MSSGNLSPEMVEEDPLPLKKTKLQETELDMTPMIDMTFQLLIFFLVTFKSDPSAGIELPPAKHGVAVSSKNAIIISVAKGDDKDSVKVYKGMASDASALITAKDPEDLETALLEYVEREATRKDKTYVLVQAGKEVRHKDVVRVEEIATRIAEVQQLFVAVLEGASQ